MDEEGKDQGANVRQKAKDITNLLTDENRLRQQRRERASMRDRMIRGANGGEREEGEGSRRRPQQEQVRRGEHGGGEDDLRRAIEASKRSLQQEQAKAEERDLAEAIKLSEQDEAKRNQAVEDSNSSALFDDQNQL